MIPQKDRIEAAIRHIQTATDIDPWAMELAVDALKAQEKKPVKLSTVCLLCKKPAVTFSTDDDIPYTNYSYCEDCLRKGLKLLKAQEACGDAVSRQTLQKELALYPIDDITSEDEAGYNRAINDVQKMVLHLPSAQTEQRWIPCSERLPNKEGNYLITAQPTYNHTKDIRIAHWSGRWVGYVRSEILAWMPLPEPYKGCDKDAD